MGHGREHVYRAKCPPHDQREEEGREREEEEGAQVPIFPSRSCPQ